ncbi:MAG: hypothetical protein ABSE99_12785 [Terracidiphilus sp.]|jgi:hypothetical protein
MLTTGLSALALFRFGFGRGGGFFSLFLLLAIAGVVAWALVRPGPHESAKN